MIHTETQHFQNTMQCNLSININLKCLYPLHYNCVAMLMYRNRNALPWLARSSWFPELNLKNLKSLNLSLSPSSRDYKKISMQSQYIASQIINHTKSQTILSKLHWNRHNTDQWHCHYLCIGILKYMTLWIINITMTSLHTMQWSMWFEYILCRWLIGRAPILWVSWFDSKHLLIAHEVCGYILFCWIHVCVWFNN